MSDYYVSLPSTFTKSVCAGSGQMAPAYQVYMSMNIGTGLGTTKDKCPICDTEEVEFDMQGRFVLHPVPSGKING